MALHPALRKHAWKPWFWLAVLKAKHKWIPCERCGFTNECLPYGESVRANYAALEKDGFVVPAEVKGPEEKSVCMHCCMEMREAHGDTARIDVCTTCQATGSHRPGCPWQQKGLVKQ